MLEKAIVTKRYKGRHVIALVLETAGRLDLSGVMYPMPLINKIVWTYSLENKLYDHFVRLATAPSFNLACLSAITLVGAFLRLYKLGEWGFWGDEMFTVSGPTDGFNYSLLRESLSLVLIRSVTTMYGLNEWNARIIPAIIGICTIPVFFVLVRKFFDVPIAIMASLLLAISPWHLYWSQNARFYTALLLFYFLAVFFFFQGMEFDKPWFLVICLGFFGLAVKERLLALFLIPVLLVYLFLLQVLSFEKPKGWRFRNALLFIIPGLIAGLFFAGPYLASLPDWFAGFGYSNNNPIWLAGGFVYYVGLPVVCLGSFAGMHLIAQKNRVGLILILSAVLPILILSIISPIHYTANRYAFVSLTSWLVLAAFGIVTLFKNITGHAKFLSIGMLLIMFASPILDNFQYYFYQNGNRDDWKSAFAYVSQHRQEDDLIASGHVLIADYYLSDDTSYFGNFDLDEFIASGERLWFVEDMASVVKFTDLHDWLIENARLMSVHDVAFQARTFTMRVYLYDPLFDQQGIGINGK